MADTVQTDGIILGAGIAGLSCADALLQNSRSCVILDPNEIGYGASCSPGMLVNPATGRRARKAWKAGECFELIYDLLERVQAETGHTIYERNGVIRPALTQKLADNFERSPEKYDWPEGWIQWLSKQEFSEKFPTFEKHFGGLFVKKALTVNGEKFIPDFSTYLTKREVILKTGDKYKLHQKEDKWIAETEDGSVYSADFVIDATGFYQVNSEYWNFIPLHPIKGQTATFIFDEPLSFQTSVSSLGYMAFMKDQPNQLTVGSTYEHDFDYLEPDEKGLSYLKKKLENTFPGLSGKCISVEQWSGVRVSVQDKKPVIGAHHKKKGLYIIGALGSKGLLMGRCMAEMLIKNILEGKTIEKSVDIARVREP